MSAPEKLSPGKSGPNNSGPNNSGLSNSGPDTLDRLFRAILARRGSDPETSYTARLFARGRAKIAQKLGEEAIETVIEAVANDKAKIAAESADLLYHLLVLWADAGLKPGDIYDVLASREGVGGIAEKASRKKGKA